MPQPSASWSRNWLGRGHWRRLILAKPIPVDEEQVAIVEVKLSPQCFMLFIFSLPYLNVPSLFQALGQALKLARLRSSVSTWEGRIHDLDSSDALLRGQINDLQAECKSSDEVVAKYKR